jgi:DNA-binding SARP family transcriptional activator
MIRLRTFGGAVLYAEDGTPMGGAAARRRTLGLLSVLAVAGDAGLSRDKLVGLFWPDVEARRARHSLTQALYVARRAVGCDDLFEVAEDIRLNARRIWSDVAALEAALQAGDDATVASLYQGPFLDGFYLSSPEFEWWLGNQRKRLEEQAVGALERLAMRAERAGDWKAAVEWWRRIAEIRPADSAVAVRLMRVLQELGDRVAALEHAEYHVRLLREQYELEPDPIVLEVAEELRGLRPGRSEAVSSLPDPVPVVEPEEVLAFDDPGELRRVGRAPLTIRVSARGYPRRGAGRVGGRGRSGAWYLAAATCGVLAAGLAFELARDRSGEPPELPRLGQRVVVAPFRVWGADPSLRYLREGMVELLSIRLADDTATRAVDAGAVLSAWRKAGIVEAPDVHRDAVVGLAARLGAERVIVGSVVGTPARAIISATAVAVPSGRVSGEATVEGPTDSLAALVDRLAGKLLLQEAPQEEPVADLTTASLPALRAFLAALPAHARGDYAAAASGYARALQLDSTFALAALRLALVAARLHDFELERRALDRAWKFRDGLSEHERTHLEALVGPSYPAASGAAEALAAWETAARLIPQRASVWYGFATRLAGDGSARALESGRERVIAALHRARLLDPQHAGARLLLARLAGGAGGDADPGDPLAPFFRWRAAAAHGDTASLARLADSLAHFSPTSLRAIVATSQFDAVRPQDGARALELLISRTAASEQAVDLILAEHSLALNRGRPSEAAAALQRLHRSSPVTRAHLRLRVLDAVYSDIGPPLDDSLVVLAARELERRTRNPGLPGADADACALAQWQLARSEVQAASRTLAVLREQQGYEPAPVGTPAPVCADLVEAWLAVLTREPDARSRVERLDRLVLTTAAVGDAAAYAHITVSRLYRALGEERLALAAIRRRPYMSAVWPRYLAAALQAEGDLARQTGDVAGALAAYGQYLALRSDPEAEVASEVQTIRGLLSALTGR